MSLDDALRFNPDAYAVAQQRVKSAPDDDMKAFLQKHGKTPATYEALDQVMDAMIAVVAKAFTERVVPLEKANADVAARLLELEASAAARSEVDA